jgi:hypothetical protein
MAYLGNAPARSFISFERQVFTIVNSQTAYTLSHSVNNENDIRLVINNVVQEPGSGKAYTASGTTLTLSAALTNGTDEMYCVFLGRAVATNAPGAGSVNTAAIAADAVTEAKIADDAVESEHLNDNVISGQTELAAEPADTDEFLVSDAGTLKRIDYSYIKGGGITMADQFRLTASKTITNTASVFDANWERIDTAPQATLNGGMTESSGVFTFPSTGIYLVDVNLGFGIIDSISTNDIRYFEFKIMATTNNSSYNMVSRMNSSAKYISNGTYQNLSCTTLIDVTSTSNVKVYFQAEAHYSVRVSGSTSNNESNEFTFIRLGDT